MGTLNYLATFLVAGVAAQVAAEEMTSNPTMPKFYYSATPEGKTLPEGVARIRLPYQMANGSTAYDKDGNKSESIVKYSATGGAFVFEYGLSDKLSLQWKTDYYLNQSTTLNTGSDAYGDTKSKAYAAASASNATLAAISKATGIAITDQASLTAALRASFVGGCVSKGVGDAATCATLYENGTLPSGTTGVSAKAYTTNLAGATESAISSGIASAAESTGGRGLGDTIVGLLYEAYNTDSFFFSVGGGVRLPTGKRDKAVNELDTTRGAYELGLRLNLDYLPIQWFMLSWQNQSEGGIASTKRDVGGVSQTTSRNGIRNVGFIYLKPSLMGISPDLDGIKTNVGVSYDYDSAEKVSYNDIETTSDRSMTNWLYAGVGYSFLGMGVPAQLDLEYEKPLSGKNVQVTAVKTTATIKAYAKF